MAVHNPRDVPAFLPERLILQIHWYREPNIQAFLRENGFQVLVLSRHPLDVLLSVLHFVQTEPEVVRWLEGNTALPAALISAAPITKSFVAYAMSFGAENLLSVSYQWWHEPGAITARYEDLVQTPKESFGRLSNALCGQPDNTPSLGKALELEPLSAFQAMPNRHGWMGTPNLWRRLITPRLAHRIYHRHRRVFETLGYAVPLNLLTPAAAARNWKRLA